MSNTQQKLEELENCLKDLTSTTIGRRSLLTTLPFVLASCATTEKTRYREGDNTGQSTDLSVSDEQQMTSQVLPKMKKDYPAVPNAELQSYIRSLGHKLVASNNLASNPYNYTFTVADVAGVNAFALPAGTVFVTAPLIAMADTEAELMGVIGHEVGHIKARHAAERMHAAKKSQSGSWLYTLGGGILGGALGYGIGKLACPPKDSKCLGNAAQLGAAAGAGGTLLIQKYGFMANSREDEMEADRIAFRTAHQTGYHKDYVGKFYEKLLAMEQKSKGGGTVPLLGSFADAMSTHPPSRERLAQMREMAGQVQNKSGSVISTKTFDRMKGIAKQYAAKAQSRAKASRG